MKELTKYLKEIGISETQIPEFLKHLTPTIIETTISNSVWTPEPTYKESLGIPDTDYNYHKISQNQNLSEEVSLTQEFLSSITKKYPNSSIEFINYGDTELVYVIKSESKTETLLVGQPATKLGTVKIEYDNLKHLAQKNPSIIVPPISYHSNGVREAYITPYLKQARCIATFGTNYGAYIPEPYYRFESYSPQDEYLICKVIIANLIRLYDNENKLALAECKIGGGDFIMDRQFDTTEHTEENTLKHMKLIAARKLINIELKEYIKLLQTEFQKRTYYRSLNERDSSTIVNIKNRVPMSSEAIDDGIELGLQLRKTK